MEEKSLVYLAIRIIVGVIFIYHGFSKIGSGYDSWINYITGEGIPKHIGTFAAIFEILIGVAILFGLYTHLAALGGLIFMIIAIYIAHRKDPILGEKGIGYQILIFILCIGLAITGGGKFSLIK